jgi:hypothetical protein
MKRWFKLLPIALILLPTRLYAANEILTGACKASDDPASCETNSSLFGTGSVLNHAISVLLFVTGSISILMIVIGGLRFVLAAGNPANIKAARETILYAVVGLVISGLAYAMVNFVLIHVG